MKVYQEVGSTKTWDVYVNFFANSTISTIEHPSPIEEGALEGVIKPVFWNGIQDYNPEINQITI